MSDKPQAGKAELRNRWKSAIDNGLLAELRSEGRLVALFVFWAADWATCDVRFSMRKIAARLGVHQTTVRRGVSQMIAAGLLEKMANSDGGKVTAFRVLDCARVVRTPNTSGAHQCARVVRTPNTSGAQSEHEPCAVRARAVRSARTLCAHKSVLPSGSQSSTGVSSEASPADGVAPSAARHELEQESNR